MNNKKLFINLCSVLVACSLLFTACKKETTAFKESSNPDENVKNIMVYAKLVNEYTLSDLHTYTEETQRMIFQEMNSDNKARIFRERIDYAIDMETDNNVISHLLVLKGKITPDVFEMNIDSSDEIEQYIEYIIPIVGYDKVKIITTTLGNSAMISNGGGGSAVLKKCNCNDLQDWCFGSPYAANCKNGNCLGSMSGCGNIWRRACDGRCTSFLG